MAAKKEYGVVIIKPDSVRDGLEGSIVQDLVNAGVVTVLGKYWTIKPEMVPVIYPKEVTKITYSSTLKAITSGPLFILIVKSPNVYEFLAKTKGKMDKGGIRHKYCWKSKQELINEGYAGQELQDKLAENRLHTSDTIEETLAVLSICLSTRETEELRDLAPDLYEKLRDHQTE
ncbi:MAG: hypothetical protein A2430_01735 [Candidatus Liptonbacteria bacterium RIFOXYC1_FULL_36_8]|uniref:Nucleoside diphosphate kinase-like domain-containing protein n=1 Tax=Candidatus Liptonbacteria bacterium RIFOXYC1_FULL_36_8 TaxID=1798655 RepID=A0A1G2CSM6_9BACT|nr:MAG: hypothetical protein A2430_01735 [Candidatus Liptonbacteria bacterium RIFOXYC1_FULL_36_8]